MALPRFFCDLPMQVDQCLELPSSVAQHAGRSLRLRQGDVIELFNGLGGKYRATLLFKEGIAKAQITGFNADNAMPLGQIHLIQALPSGDKMDWIIEKASELGVHSLYPVQSERSIVQLKGDRLEKRLHRWQSIAINAAEQCGRNQVLHLQSLGSLEETIKHCKADLFLLCHPTQNQSLTKVLSTFTGQSIALLIGPEGGWSDQEIALLTPWVQTVQWGARVLRTETAGMALTAACLQALGW